MTGCRGPFWSCGGRPRRKHVDLITLADAPVDCQTVHVHDFSRAQRNILTFGPLPLSRHSDSASSTSSARGCADRGHC